MHVRKTTVRFRSSRRVSRPNETVEQHYVRRYLRLLGITCYIIGYIGKPHTHTRIRVYFFITILRFNFSILL